MRVLFFTVYTNEIDIQFVDILIVYILKYSDLLNYMYSLGVNFYMRMSNNIP